MNENPFYSIFRLILHNNPGFIFRTMHKNPEFCSVFRFNMYQKAPVLLFCMLNMDSLEVAAS